MAERLYRVVGACIAYRRNNAQAPFEYLFVQHGDLARANRGKWVPPGGGLTDEDLTNPESSPLQVAVRREVREETGIRVGELRHLGEFVSQMDDGTPIFGNRYAAPYLKGKLTLERTLADGRWIPYPQLADYDIVGEVYKVVQDLNRWLHENIIGDVI